MLCDETAPTYWEFMDPRTGNRYVVEPKTVPDMDKLVQLSVKLAEEESDVYG